MVNLNVFKPVSKYQKEIAKKCGWSNADQIPVRKNILPDGFVGSAKSEPNVPVIGTKLNPNNVTIMEIVMNNDKISRSPFVRSNLTQILDVANSEQGSKMMQKILTPENIDKLDTVRTFVKRHPNDYIKDKSQVKYISSPAGLSALFNDIAMLKAASVLDLDGLNALFKLDVTQGKGQKLLETVAKYDDLHLDIARKGMFKNAVFAVSKGK